MISTFGTYSISQSGMRASQAALTASSNNLANVNTNGASRVRVANRDTSVTQTDGTTRSSGVDVASITRARDALLDAAYRTENSDYSHWAVKNGNLEYMQKLLGEFDADDGTSSDGLQELINKFFSRWDTLSGGADNRTSRQAVTDAAAKLLKGMSEVDEQLKELQQDAVSGVTDGVDSLNTLAEQVAGLNQRISAAEVNGSEASYLRDQRDALIDQMSSLADVRVNEANGVFTVTIGGATLVDGATTRKLTVEGSGTESDPLSLKWADTGKGAVISSGSIAAYLEDANQTGYENIDGSSLRYDFTAGSISSITNLRQALNDLVTTIAQEVNSLHTSGSDLKGNAGLPFFTSIDSSQPLSIDNIQVNPALLDDPDLVVTAAAGAKSGDNSISDAIYGLSEKNIFKFNGLAMNPANFYKTVVSWVGTLGDNANNSYETQEALVNQVDNQRQSISSISLDEEMSNLIKYQNAYSANARVLSTIDGLIGDLLDTVD
ncbi:hypothetical protein P22_1425 [Propionispora sp. 2/2-37]|uniref:flagellar hook-associated protein FlgK n=1 Tax=Propionispora sp. 2/2-37 TaxID=1677858 RepID=UPI0006BB56CC|nr:flagellar hook-associated protein FlgK [Propionispora sp. 2/2-37]CUH95355.1 hypothetical protein P22_1425 [Propionispora sp. 2/2-37]